jgi:hypothetical protein
MMKLNEKDKRALKIGALLAVAILVFVFGSKWRGRWAQARAKGAALSAKLDAIDVNKARQKGLMSLVPAFEMPEIEAEQKFLFREKLNDQLKKAGINSEVIQIQTARKSPLAGYKLLHLTCNAKCKFSQVLDLLTRLNENPYLVGIEEFKIKVDAKKRQEVQLNLTVSTFVR